jgi:hypothetical protein
MGLLSWLQMGCNETYSVDESCLGQQRLRAMYIATDAIRTWTGVKLIRRFYGMFDLCFHVGEKLHATAFELKI